MGESAELIVTGPDGARTRHSLGVKATIGRHPGCEVVLTDPQASRWHCILERVSEGIPGIPGNSGTQYLINNFA